MAGGARFGVRGRGGAVMADLRRRFCEIDATCHSLPRQAEVWQVVHVSQLTSAPRKTSASGRDQAGPIPGISITVMSARRTIP